MLVVSWSCRNRACPMHTWLLSFYTYPANCLALYLLSSMAFTAQFARFMCQDVREQCCGGSNSGRANPSSTSVALLPGSTTTKPTFLRTKPCSWHVIPFIRVIQAAFWCGFSKNSWRGLFCDSVKSCENYYFAIY